MFQYYKNDKNNLIKELLILYRIQIVYRKIEVF